jgi:hypothetical protein
MDAYEATHQTYDGSSAVFDHLVGALNAGIAMALASCVARTRCCSEMAESFRYSALRAGLTIAEPKSSGHGDG